MPSAQRRVPEASVNVPTRLQGHGRTACTLMHKRWQKCFTHQFQFPEEREALTERGLVSKATHKKKMEKNHVVSC